MNKLKFRTQLIIGFITLIFFNFLITNRAIIQIRKISSDTQLIYEHPLIVSNAVRDINININAIHRSMIDLVFSENIEQLNNSLQLVKYYDSLNYVAFNIVKEKFLGDISIVNDAYKTAKDWEIIRNEVIELQKAGNNIEAIKITRGKGAEQAMLVFEKTKILTDFAQNKADELYQDTTRRRDNSIKILYASMFIFFLLGIIVSYIISKSILKPINKFISEVNSIYKKNPLKEKNFLTRSEQEILSETALELQAAYDKLDNFNKELEQKVEVRTIEINAQNESLKENELILKDSESALRDAQEIGNMGSWVLSFVDQKAVWSKNCFKMYGYKPFEFEPTFEHFKNRVHPDDWHIIEKHIESVVSNKDITYSEMRVILPDGTVKWFQNNVVGIFQSEKLVKLSGINIDITKRKLVELELERSREILQNLNIDKDRFISILGHDLRNPFNNILGLSEILSEEIHQLNKQEIQDIAKNIIKSTKITNKLLEDILLWARAKQGKIPFNPQNLIYTEICNDAVEILKPNANAKNITINYSETDRLNVFADTDMVNAVMRNLVSNAIKFTNIGGTISIKAEQNSENVTISVSDNGIGIEPDDLKKLFDISEVLTTKGTAGETGTGLGLLLCKEFVEKHGGKIWVESVVRKGSDFKFTLPVSTEQVNVINNE